MAVTAAFKACCGSSGCCDGAALKALICEGICLYSIGNCGSGNPYVRYSLYFGNRENGGCYEDAIGTSFYSQESAITQPSYNRLSVRKKVVRKK